MKKKWNVIEVPKSGVKNWNGGAFTYAFVYSNKGNFLVKGYIREVDEYIEKNFSRFFVRFALYQCGMHRDIMRFGQRCHLYLGEPTDPFGRRDRGNRRYVVYPHNYGTNLNTIKLTFKRFPKKWIPEFDYLIDKYCKNIPSGNKY